MRVKAQVTVNNRMLSNQGGNCKSAKGKPPVSSLAIGRKPKHLIKDQEKDPEVFVLHCTAQNKSGFKYAVRNNVEKLFTRFVDEGKATLRFTSPPHDLCVSNADVVALKAFLNVLAKVIAIKPGQDAELEKLVELNLSALAPASSSQVTKEKTKMVIANKRDYPITTNFPHTLKELRAVDINLKRIDTRMFKLKSLAVLDLSGNSITSLPKELTALPLQELILCRNKLQRIEATFISNPAFCISLKCLDISDNQIKFMPNFMSKFKSLVCLKLGGNPMRSVLPLSLFNSGKLRVLSLENLTEMPHLPSTTSKMYLDKLFVTRSCKFMQVPQGGSRSVVHNTLENVPTLEDMALKAVHHKVRHAEGSWLPPALSQKMDSFQVCICGNYCLASSHAAAISPLDIHKIAANVHADELLSYDANTVTVFCSQKCLKRFTRGNAPT